VNSGQSVVLDWHTPQGTSLGAPQWAALIAIANQGRVLEGEPTLSNVPAELYSLSPNDFNDITSGPANREGYSPGPGYDEITGLGTPKADKLVPDLVNQPFILPPWILHEVQLLDSLGGDFNGFMFTPQAQVMQGSLATSDGSFGQFAGLNLGSLLSAGTISSTPTAANVINAPTPANGSEGWAFRSTKATGSVSASGLRVQQGSDSLARLTPGDGSFTDADAASLGDGIQWAGLEAALQMLDA
jgi:hypothetical protein